VGIQKVGYNRCIRPVGEHPDFYARNHDIINQGFELLAQSSTGRRVYCPHALRGLHR
jgi:hypothetical protein